MTADSTACPREAPSHLTLLAGLGAPGLLLHALLMLPRRQAAVFKPHSGDGLFSSTALKEVFTGLVCVQALVGQHGGVCRRAQFNPLR